MAAIYTLEINIAIPLTLISQQEMQVLCSKVHIRTISKIGRRLSVESSSCCCYNCNFFIKKVVMNLLLIPADIKNDYSMTK